MVGNLSRELVGMLDSTGNLSVDFPSHLVQEIDDLWPELVNSDLQSYETCWSNSPA